MSSFFPLANVPRFPALTTINGGLWIEQIPFPAFPHLPELTTVKTIYVYRVDQVDSSVRSTTHIPGFKANSANFTTVSFPKLDFSGLSVTSFRSIKRNVANTRWASLLTVAPACRRSRSRP